MNARTSDRKPTDKEVRNITVEAAGWLLRLETATEQDREAFARWLLTSPLHVEKFLRMSATAVELATAEVVSSQHDALSKAPQSSYTPLLKALIREKKPARELYNKCRTPLLLMFISHRIDRATANDLLQQAFVQTLRQFRPDDTHDYTEVTTSLHRIAAHLITTHRHRRLALIHASSRESLPLDSPELLSLEERLDHAFLSRSVRVLMRVLGSRISREALRRFYLRGESRRTICNQLDMTEEQFLQILWRTRYSFARILERQGHPVDRPSITATTDVYCAAYYVAHALDARKRDAFELKMIQDQGCIREVDVWSTIRSHLPHAERKRAVTM